MRIVLLGGGGHASDVLGAFEALVAAHEGTPPFELIGCLADGPVDERRFEGRALEHLGAISDLRSTNATHFVSCVGYPAGRKKLTLLAVGAGLEPFTVIHPRSWVPRGVQVGPGSVLLAGSILSPKCRIGAHVLIGQGAVVGHDSQIGDFTSIMPAACISGGTQIGAECMLGANCTVLEKLSIGDRAVVGAGAVVVRSVPAGATAIGVPARQAKG